MSGQNDYNKTKEIHAVNIASLAAMFATILGISLVLLRLHEEAGINKQSSNDAYNQQSRSPTATSGDFIELDGHPDGFSVLDEGPMRSHNSLKK